MIGGDRLLTVPEVAEWLRVHPESVRRWIRQGRLRGVLLGGTRAGYRIAQSEVQRFITAGPDSGDAFSHDS